MYHGNYIKKVLSVICMALLFTTLACSLQKTEANSPSGKEPSALETTAHQGYNLTAQEILDQSTEAMKNVQTMSLQLSVSSGGAGLSIEITGEGVIEQPDKSYIIMDYAGQTMEILTLSKTELYMKQPGSTNWEAVQADQINPLSGMNVGVIQQLGFVSFANEINLVDPEIIDGVDCFHLTYSLDMTKYLSQLGEVGVQIDASSASGSGELWIGQADFLIRKFVFNLEVVAEGVNINASTHVKLSNFNEPVVIPVP